MLLKTNIFSLLILLFVSNSWGQTIYFTIKPTLGKYWGFCEYGELITNFRTGKKGLSFVNRKPITNSIYNVEKSYYSPVDNFSFGAFIEMNTQKKWNIESGLFFNEGASLNYRIGFFNYTPITTPYVGVGRGVRISQLKIPLFLKYHLFSFKHNENKEADFKFLIGLNFGQNTSKGVPEDNYTFSVGSDIVSYTTNFQTYSNQNFYFDIGSEIILKKNNVNKLSIYLYYERGLNRVIAVDNVNITTRGYTYSEYIYTKGNAFYLKLAYSFALNKKKKVNKE